MASGRRLLLDLGRVESVAQVTLNGPDLGIVWKPPYILDVTSALRSGQNELVVQVIGTWRNRLIGDAKYANGFPKPDGPNAARALEFKPYLTADLKISPNEALSPYGLLGPVRLLATQTVTVRP